MSEDAPQNGGNALYRDTDIGNSVRFIAEHGEKICYSYDRKSWLIFDGTRWKRDECGQVEKFAQQTAVGLFKDIARAQSEGERKALTAFAKSSATRRKISDFVALAQWRRAIPADRFDADTNLLNCNAGTIDLATGLLNTHDRADLLTKLLGTHYDPTAKCPTWDAFLTRIMAGDASMLEFLQRAVGYSLTGSRREQCMFILHGTGANGKSVFLDTIFTMLGEYATKMASDSLCVKQAGAMPTDIARLHGARFVVASETEDGRRLAESRVKEMTGDENLVGERKFEEAFNFSPQFVLWLATNHRPTIRGTDNGIWRRLREIPFAVTIPEEERDGDLLRKLRVELPGILNWALEGCRKWQESGLSVPVAVKEATNKYRNEMDVMAAFLDECCDTAPTLSCTVAELYKRYTRWAEENGEYKQSQRALGKKLEDKGFERKRRTGGVWHWNGLNVKVEAYGV